MIKNNEIIEINILENLFKKIEIITDEENLQTKYKLDIVNMLNKLKEEEAKILVDKILIDESKTQKLALLITKMDFINGSNWISLFQGKIYGFTKFWKKNYIMKFPNYSINIGD